MHCLGRDNTLKIRHKSSDRRLDCARSVHEKQQRRGASECLVDVDECIERRAAVDGYRCRGGGDWSGDCCCGGESVAIAMCDRARAQHATNLVRRDQDDHVVGIGAEPPAH